MSWWIERELSPSQREGLSPTALYRYEQARRRRRNRLSRKDAYALALAITRNDADQRARRLGHDTGAVNWL